MVDTPTCCQHQDDLAVLTQLSTAALRRGSSTGTLAALVQGEEIQIRCQEECGEASPWWGTTITRTDQAEALASLRPTGYLDVFVETWAEMFRDTRALLTRLGTRRRRTRDKAVAADESTG